MSRANLLKFLWDKLHLSRPASAMTCICTISVRQRNKLPAFHYYPTTINLDVQWPKTKKYFSKIKFSVFWTADLHGKENFWNLEIGAEKGVYNEDRHFGYQNLRNSTFAYTFFEGKNLLKGGKSYSLIKIRRNRKRQYSLISKLECLFFGHCTTSRTFLEIVAAARSNSILSMVKVRRGVLIFEILPPFTLWKPL